MIYCALCLDLTRSGVSILKDLSHETIRMIRIPVVQTPDAMPPPQMVLRSRREVSTRDFINATQYEHWQTDSPAMTTNRPDLNKQAPFYDMKPLQARTDGRSFLQSQPYVADAGMLDTNPYFQKYDVKSDPRNVTRELRGAVFETPGDRGLAESKRMLERQFTAAYVPEDRTLVDIETNLKARERLLPMMDDMSKIYPKTINSWGVCRPGADGENKKSCKNQ